MRPQAQLLSQAAELGTASAVLPNRPEAFRLQHKVLVYAKHLGAERHPDLAPHIGPANTPLFSTETYPQPNGICLKVRCNCPSPKARIILSGLIGLKELRYEQRAG